MTALGSCIEGKTRKSTSTNQTYCVMLVSYSCCLPTGYKLHRHGFGTYAVPGGVNNQTQQENSTE